MRESILNFVALRAALGRLDLAEVARRTVEAAEGYMPGKLFEYLATGLPVLGVGPSQGDAGLLLNQSKAGSMLDADQADKIEAFVLDKFEQWRSGTALNSSRTFSNYSRKALTHALTELL